MPQLHGHCNQPCTLLTRLKLLGLNTELAYSAAELQKLLLPLLCLVINFIGCRLDPVYIRTTFFLSFPFSLELGA